MMDRIESRTLLRLQLSGVDKSILNGPRPWRGLGMSNLFETPGHRVVVFQGDVQL